MPLITLNETSKVYGFGNAATLALDEISLEINQGEFVGIMGPSGSGKTTLLNILGLLDKPTHGEYVFDERNIAKASARKRCTLRRDHIGFIFQDFNLLPNLTLVENVALPLLYKGIFQSKRLKLAKAMMERVGLGDKLYYYPNQVSGGQMQRAAIARALINAPKIIIADEPTGNLDSNNARLIMELLGEINGFGNTIIMVTHNPVLTRFTSRILYMYDGSIVYDEKTAIGEMPERVKKALGAVSTDKADDNIANVSALEEIISSQEAANVKKSQKKHRKPKALKKNKKRGNK